MAGELGSSERSLGKELGQLPEGSVQAKVLKPHDQKGVLLVRAGGAGTTGCFLEPGRAQTGPGPLERQEQVDSAQGLVAVSLGWNHRSQVALQFLLKLLQGREGHC